MSDITLSQRDGVSTPRWVPETPFLEIFEANEVAGSSTRVPTIARIESPFYSGYREARDADEVDPMSSAIAELLDELHDEEFDEALFELVDEAWELGGPRITHEARQSAQWDARAERMLWEHFQPLARQAENMADALSEHFSTSSGDLSDAELEQSIESFAYEAYNHEGLSPAFENFLKSWGKKLKNAATGAVRLAKKVVQRGSDRRRSVVAAGAFETEEGPQPDAEEDCQPRSR